MALALSPTRSALAAAALLLAVVLPGAALAQSQPLTVEIDQSARIALRGSAGSVIVGNPAIADVTVVDPQTLFITGKGYGLTEIVAVDAIGRTLFQGQIVVVAPSQGVHLVGAVGQGRFKVR